MRVIDLAVFLFVVTAWLFATGGELVSCTVILTVAVLLSTLPSFALNVKESGPT